MVVQFLSVLVFTISIFGEALACPVCDTETGQKIRAVIVNDHFLYRLVIIVLPITLMLGAVLAVQFLFRPRKDM
jgi:hypothetical protein